MKNTSIASPFSVGLISVVLFLCSGLNACAQEVGTKIVEDEMAQIKKLAAEKYPNLPLNQAMALVAEERNKSRIAKNSVKNQQILAAVGFSTFYRANTAARSSYCAKAGIDISSFVAAFQKEHALELSQADIIFRDSETDFEKDWLSLRPSAEAWANDDMQQIASQRGSDAAGACRLFADQPEEVAKLLNYSDTKPEERGVLLSYKTVR